MKSPVFPCEGYTGLTSICQPQRDKIDIDIMYYITKFQMKGVAI